MIRKVEGDPTFRATRMVYNTKQEVVGLFGEEWQETNPWPPTGVCTDANVAYQKTFAWEYRYDNGSTRYMRRMLSPNSMAEVLTEWSDYDEAGNLVADFEAVTACNTPPPLAPPVAGDKGEGFGGTEGQVELWPLLCPGRIGVALSSEFQLEPEQTTTAIICHHQHAKYFNVR